jgi:transcription elongation factor Elf1
MPELGGQFNCPDCGTPQYSENGFEPHDHKNACPTCGESTADGHWHIELEPTDIDFYRKVNEMGNLQHQLDNIDATRTVDLTNKQDLIDHLASDNGHGFGRYAGWCRTYEGLNTNKNCNKELDHEMTLTQLQSVHQELHDQEDIPHENDPGSIYWRTGTHKHLE